ncbi:MAG: hypothetical protein D6711_16435 [Chloroflexi bacterium]|nr:MAG: hypothetical protein D6711_16435 [Chloroflexota bacterium]
MAVTKTDLTSGSISDNLSVNSVNTASISPSSDKLIIVAVLNSDWMGTLDVPTVSGCGLTWVQIGSINFDYNGAKMTLFRAMGSSPSAGSLTISTATPQGCYAWSVVEFGNVDTSGTNGSGAVVQYATGSGFNKTNLTITLGAFGSINNATYGFFGIEDPFIQNVSPGTGFTEIHESHQTGPTRYTLFTEWRSDNDTTVNCSVPTFSVDYAGIAIEIKESSGGSPPGTISSKRVIIGHGR